MRPIIGITCDRAPEANRYHSIIHYANAVEKAGGLPLLLPHLTSCIDEYLQLCQGFVLTGGDDPVTEVFGKPTHPKADVMNRDRQNFELFLIAALDHTHHPVLGICLGMQLMALHHGGCLYQHLPDDCGDEIAALHLSGEHDIQCVIDNHPVMPSVGKVFSKHHQAIADPGTMRTVAIAQDGVIEAIDLPDSPDKTRFYMGVQWHPERTEDVCVGHDLFQKLVSSSLR